MRLLLLFIFSMCLNFIMGCHDRIDPAKSLQADLAIQFECQNAERSQIEYSVETFLVGEKFKVLNLGQIRLNHKYTESDSYIIGLDNPKRILTFSAPYKKMSNIYAIVFSTPPPTVRQIEFEAKLQNFVVAKLGCNVSQITQGKNEATAADMYWSDLERKEKLFEESLKKSKQSKGSGSNCFFEVRNSGAKQSELRHLQAISRDNTTTSNMICRDHSTAFVLRNELR